VAGYSEKDENANDSEGIYLTNEDWNLLQQDLENETWGDFDYTRGVSENLWGLGFVNITLKLLALSSLLGKKIVDFGTYVLGEVKEKTNVINSWLEKLKGLH
jgi:hypothetical protein